MKCLSYLELYAGKLNAMLDRQHPKDIFDMRIYLQKNKNLDSLMDVFIAYLAQGNRPFSEILEPNLLNIKDIFVNSFVGMTEEISLEELLAVRISVINRVKKSLTAKHKDFLLSLMHNQPDWSLLPFPNLQNLPALNWKLQNIAKMSAAKDTAEIKKLEKNIENNPRA
ncbi:toxin AbiEi [Candidatus Termititenax aidoneus]|uniref:Toxin AbiEi n=1 Tax=Termititenax aidoneus TaxID=2218524 RepID=A0A388T8J6_TERA1|nr:toxin AbiEi [Candidatus Termititenax aidoneus]